MLEIISARPHLGWKLIRQEDKEQKTICWSLSYERVKLLKDKIEKDQRAKGGINLMTFAFDQLEKRKSGS